MWQKIAPERSHTAWFCGRGVDEEEEEEMQKLAQDICS